MFDCWVFIMASKMIWSYMVLRPANIGRTKGKSNKVQLKPFDIYFSLIFERTKLNRKLKMKAKSIADVKKYEIILSLDKASKS